MLPYCLLPVAGVVVDDAHSAFEISVKNGAIPATPPFTLRVSTSLTSIAAVCNHLLYLPCVQCLSWAPAEVPYSKLSSEIADMRLPAQIQGATDTLLRIADIRFSCELCSAGQEQRIVPGGV